VTTAFDRSAKRRVAVTNDISMAYVDTGAGDPVIFLHGNPTSSWLWRDVVAPVATANRCLAPDLIGMGDSDKLPSPGPDTYGFKVHRAHLDAWFEAVLGPSQPAILVVHDWGSALGFDWAARHPARVRGIAYMESIVWAASDWSDWDPGAAALFQRFRSNEGEALILDGNRFVERVLPGSIQRTLSAAEFNEYRRPFLARDDRWPTLSWPREIPIGGQPTEVVAIVDRYAEWMATNDIPKLFVNADPGAILTGAARAFCRTWPNQQELTVPGIHFLQEDSGVEIGEAISTWIREKL
jgi:haloalkane dehalogenase